MDNERQRHFNTYRTQQGGLCHNSGQPQRIWHLGGRGGVIDK